MFTTILIIFCKNTNKRNIPKEKANKKMASLSSIEELAIYFIFQFRKMVQESIAA